MLVSIFDRGTGAGKGPVLYCIAAIVPEYDPVTRKRTGELIHRDPLPVVVKGDPDRTIMLIDSSQNRWKYTSGVIAFSDTDNPTLAEQDTVIASFEQTFCPGLDLDQFDALWTRHLHEGNVELHFVIPRLELTTGKSMNIAPPGYETMMSAWRDTWNYAKGWASPDEPERAQLTKQTDHVLKIDKALLRAHLPKSEDPKRLIGEYLITCIQAGNLKNRSDVIAMLEDAGMEITRQGKDYVSVRPEPGAKPIRLKGALYDEQFEIDYNRADAILEQLGVSRQPGGSPEGENSGANWRNPDADRERVAEASAKLERFVAARTRFNEQRYRPPAQSDQANDARHGKRREERPVADSGATIEADRRNLEAANDADRSNQHSARLEEISDRTDAEPVASDVRASERASENVSIESDQLSAEVAWADDAISLAAANSVASGDQPTDEAASLANESASVDSGCSLPRSVRRDLGLDAAPDEPGISVRTGSSAALADDASDDQHADTAVLSNTGRPSKLQAFKSKLGEVYDRTRNAIVGRFHEALDAVQRGYDALIGVEHGLAVAGLRLVESRRHFDEAATRAGDAEQSLRTVAAKAHESIERGITMTRIKQSDELENFKSQINLVEYAESIGYEVDAKESSKGSTVMRNGSDKVIIATDSDGHSIYFSVRDVSDNGSIIDFVQKREGKNLGQVRQALRPWVKGSPASYIPRASAQQRVKPVATNADRQRVFAVWSKMPPGDGEHLYLTVTRKLATSTQKDPRFIGMFRTDVRGNAVFPHYDEAGLTGYELKNTSFTGFASGGEKALWHSANIDHARTLVIIESAIDAMSYAEMKRDTGSAFVSMGGQPSSKQWALLTERMKSMTQVVIATDNDPAGEALAVQIKAFAPPGAVVLRDAPRGKDWNDDLVQSKSAPPSAPPVSGIENHPYYIPTSPTPY